MMFLANCLFLCDSAHLGFTHTLFNASAAPNPSETDVSLLNEISMINFDPADQSFGSEPTSAAWRKTLTAWQCRLHLVAYEYSNVSVVNSTVQTPKIQKSALNFTGPGPILTFQALHKPWPGNHNYTINYYDLSNFGGIFFNLLDYFAPSSQAPSVVSALNTVKNMSERFDGIATSMTNHIMVASPNKTTTSGSVYLPQNYVIVKWAW